jgi:hypothetical protein
VLLKRLVSTVDAAKFLWIRNGLHRPSWTQKSFKHAGLGAYRSVSVFSSCRRIENGGGVGKNYREEKGARPQASRDGLKDKDGKGASTSATLLGRMLTPHLLYHISNFTVHGRSSLPLASQLHSINLASIFSGTIFLQSELAVDLRNIMTIDEYLELIGGGQWRVGWG